MKFKFGNVDVSVNLDIFARKLNVQIVIPESQTKYTEIKINAWKFDDGGASLEVQINPNMGVVE